MKGKHTGERLETFIFNGNTINHLHRYALALELSKNKIVLDIASGEGYGSHLLSSEAKYVYGVDIDNETIIKAENKYKKKNLKFLTGSTSAIPLENNSVDVVVSFETLEHHNQHQEMMLEITRVMKPEGILLISTPDKYYYSDVRAYENKFHVKELYKNEFIELISEYFEKLNLFSQSYFNRGSIIVNDNQRDDLKFYSGDYLKLKSVDSYPNFLIALCTNHELINFENSIFEGHQLIENKIIERKIDAIYKSNTYKLGYFILLPFKFIKSLFSKLLK
jgi:ubiquinone/menaquinone biosynthesis C-methylase UbiE